MIDGAGPQDVDDAQPVGSSKGVFERLATKESILYGDPDVVNRISGFGAPATLAVVGSRMEGTAVSTSDRDLRGLYVASLEVVGGLSAVPDSLTSSTGDETWWEVAHAVKRAANGSDAVVQALFSPEQLLANELAETLIAHRQQFVTLKLVESMYGHASAQSLSPDATAKHLGMAFQLYKRAELAASDGEYLVPLPDDLREIVLSIRRGDVDAASATKHVEEARQVSALAIAKSVLPASVDMRAASDLVVQLRHAVDEIDRGSR
jgi:hypothetical protein